MSHASIVNICSFNQAISSHLGPVVLRAAEQLCLRLECPCGKDMSWGKAQGSSWIGYWAGMRVHRSRVEFIFTFSPFNNPV